MRFLDVLPLAISAGAFLVPAEIKEHGEAIALPAVIKHERFVLECDGGCPVFLAKESKDVHAYHGTKLHPGRLVADVNIVDDRVLLNGQQIWPQVASKPLSMKQIADGSQHEPFADLVSVSTSVEYKETKNLVDATDHIKLHPISIEVLAIQMDVVHAQSVEIRVAETKQGVALLPSLIKAYESSPFTDACTTVWCRVKGTVAKKFNQWSQVASSKIKAWRGCGRNKVHKINGIPVRGGPAKFAPGSSLDPNRHHKANEHHGHHGHHAHHAHHQGNIRAFLITLFEKIVFPTISGLFVGYIIGASLWTLVNIVRGLLARSRAGYVIVEPVFIEEGLVEPPKYEEVYREPQLESEDEKKELLQ